MKAVYIKAQGGPEVLEYGEIPDPNPGDGEILVRVQSSALNRLDLYTRAGTKGAGNDLKFPHVLGGDCAGMVVALGEGVGAPVVGQRVVVNPFLGPHPSPQMIGTSRNGSNAELVVVPAENAVPLPNRVSSEQAAALPTVFLPVWSIIRKIGALQPTETALVLSASSGVGTAAIQVIKNVVGATCIAATSSDPKAKAARDLGADFVINYEKEDLGTRLKEITGGHGVNLVVDPSGARFFEATYAGLARGARYGICGVTSGHRANLHLGQLFSKQLHLFGVFMGTTQTLREVVRATNRGLIRSVVHRSLPLSDIRLAHEEMERSEHFGKFVFNVSSD